LEPTGLPEMENRPKLHVVQALKQLFLLFAVHSLFLFPFTLSEIFFEERFEDGWKGRWVLSDWKRSEGKAGTFKYTAGKWPGDPDDKGTITCSRFDLFVFMLSGV